MKQEPVQLKSISAGHGLSRPTSRAFNLLEMLVVIALIGILAIISYTSLDRTLPRQKLRGKATEISGFLQKARLGAIKEGRDVAVEVEKFGDQDEWLIASRINDDGSKTELARILVGDPARPFDPHLAGVTGESGGAEEAITFDSSKLIYKPTGNAASVGAFRISIGQAGRQNTIEVAVQSLGGQPVIRKYIQPADRPAGNVTTKFFADTHYGTNWDWSWY